ncbi:MAG: carboxy terminal-processing peptidase [Akkermansiaceae bacterium]|nr:carboxy terminal-processing peptidase [Akkermansiaceae bacterium]
MLNFRKLTTAVILFTGLFSPAPAHGADFELVGRELARMLQNGHYARLAFNEDLSRRFLERYLDSLDGNKIYFSDWEVADMKRRYERVLHDRISTKSIMPVANSIHEIYRKRVMARVAYVKNLLAAKEFSFEEKRAVIDDRSEASWPVNDLELRKIWSDDLESLLLSEMVRRARLKARAIEAGKPDPFRRKPSSKKAIELKFERLLKSIEEIEQEDVANSFFSAVTKAYDPHSEYFSANEMAQFKIDVSNELVGIGARLHSNDNGEIEIKGIVNGGPADRQGDLKLGDRITAISAENDGKWKSVLFKSIDRVIEDILGEKDAPVGLRVRREVNGEDQVTDIAIPRGVVTMKDELATARIYDYRQEKKSLRLAVITIPSFYFDFEKSGSRVSVDVERLLGRLKTEKIDGLVLDLRDNTGGSLPEVQRLTGFFTGRGPVVQVRSKSGQIRALNSLHRKPFYDGPLIVLVNKNSASATEILAGALQDYNRAVVVGTSSTYGKGTVQKMMDISEYMPILADREGAGWLKLTFQKYYRVSGSSVQIKGVVPDLILPGLSDAYEKGEGFKKYALPHDIIRRSSDFMPLERDELFISELTQKSRERVDADPYYKYLSADIERAKETLKKNLISLNLDERLAELKEEESRRALRIKERTKRFAVIKKRDQKELRIYRLTLDDVNADKIPLVDPKEETDDYIRRAVDEIADLEKTLKWPNGIDAVKREGLHVLLDLINAIKAEALAQADAE